MHRMIILTTVAVILGACAGRAPSPVAVSQSHDLQASCVALQAEIEANNQRVRQLADEKGIKLAQNVAAGVAGLFIWPLWFAMDLQGTADTEINALQARQQYLATLATQRCGARPPAKGPAR